MRKWISRIERERFSSITNHFFEEIPRYERSVLKSCKAWGPERPVAPRQWHGRSSRLEAFSTPLSIVGFTLSFREGERPACTRIEPMK